MLDLNFVPQNTEVKNNNIFNTKISSKKDNKDFLQILEGQKDNIKKASKETNIFDRKVEKKMWKIVEKEQPKAIEDNLEKTEELETDEEEMKVMTILQSLFSLYGLLEELDTDSKKIEETVFELIEIEIGETLNLLEEIFNGEILVNEELLLETTENIEQFINLLENEIEQYEEVYNEEMKLPVEEALSKLEKEVENLKGFVTKSSKPLIEKEIEIEENSEGNLNTIENISIELEDTKKESLSNKKEDTEMNLPKEENVETEENQIPNFEMKSQIVQEESNVLEVEKPQNIEPPKIVEQIVDKAKLIVDDFKQEIKISLKPEVLGDVVLKMEAVKGSITTKIMVDNHRTKELIEANLYQLKEEMKENGLEIKTFEVFVGSNEDFQRERSQEFFLNKKPRKIKIKDEEIDEIKKYDTNILQEMDNAYNVYGESKLNLFA
ncbi:MAG: flagellar hook-length control protein FliK [Tissierellia bacterium]|nr:flagellar hook-length control protein FliK [Tissierellia bacterium]